MDAFYMARGGVQYGPFTEIKMKELIAQQRLIGSDLVWFAGQAAWQPAAEVLGTWLSAAAQVPPPLPALMPPPIPQRAMTVVASAQPGLDTATGQPGATEMASIPSSPSSKHVESLKSMIGTDKLIDPKRISDSLGQVFQPPESGQAQADDAGHGADEGYEDAEHDDEDDED